MGMPGPQMVDRYGVEFKLTAVKMSESAGVLIKDVGGVTSRRANVILCNPQPCGPILVKNTGPTSGEKNGRRNNHLGPFENTMGPGDG
jgi:hypothetical protein